MERMGESNRAVKEDTGRRLRHGDRAVSEVISVVLLLAIVVMGVGIIAVTIYSQPMPEETPQVSILVSGGEGVISLTHNGGDALAEGSFYVLADGVRLDGPVSPPGGAGTWSIGEVLQYNAPSAPKQVQIVYDGGGGATLLKSATFTGAAGAGGPDVPVGPGGGEWVESELNLSFDTTEERDKWVVEQFVSQFEGDSILLSRGGCGSDGSISGTISFTVAESGSYLIIGTTKVPLYVGDDVEITINDGDKTHVQIFMIGDKGWSIKMIEKAPTIVISNISTTVPSGELKESWIQNLTNFQSTLEMKVGKQEHWTRLLIDGEMRIDSQNTSLITCTNIKPSNPTLWIIDFPSQQNDPVMYMGKATSVQVDKEIVYSEL